MISMKILFGSLEVSTSNKYAKFQSLTLLHSERPKLYAILAFLSAIGLILEGIFIVFSRYTMKTLEYGRKEVLFALLKFFTIKIFLSLGNKKKSLKKVV